MQSIGRRRHLGHRRRSIPGSSEAGGGKTGFPDQPIDPRKGRTVGSAPEDGMRAQA